MTMTGLEIFKYMPAGKKTSKANCKECGCPTCMMFSLKLAKNQIEVNKCPYIDPEFEKIYLYNSKQPQKTIKIGDLKIGGENVLYRHEKTFVNPTIIAIMVDCAHNNCYEKIKQITQYSLCHAGENFKIDLIILKNSQNLNENTKNFGIETITYEEYKNIELDIIQDENFEQTKNYLIYSRKKAIEEKDENYSKPVCVEMKSDNIYNLCARAGYYICKYANMLVFDDFYEELFSTILTLRYNIFTDPQKTLQVESGLYTFNNPDENSIVFLTTNFALTYFAVANELENLDIPSYLIVVPSQGMSVLTAWSAQTFTPEIVEKTLLELDIKNKIKTRKIIISALLSELKDELNEKLTDFKFIEGTKDASDIGKFVREYNNSDNSQIYKL